MAVDYAALKKGGFMCQKQKDNFSLRLQVVGGHLTAQQLVKIAEVSEKFGDGYVHLTSRQSVEIPFIKLENIDEVKQELAKGECGPGACGPRVRTITACQGSAVCQSGNIDCYDIAKKLNDRYFAKELPHKFKFGVTGCANNCLKAEENDLGIKGACTPLWKEEACVMCGKCEKVCRAKAMTKVEGQMIIDKDKCRHCGQCVKVCPKKTIEGTTGFNVSFGGLFGNRVYKGDNYLPIIRSEKKLFQITDEVVKFFEEYAKPKERLRFTIERVGEEKFIERLQKAYND